MPRKDFQSELTSLINRYSRENESNTPDWILSNYIENCLLAFNTAVQQRENYYGRDPRPTEIKSVTTNKEKSGG